MTKSYLVSFWFYFILSLFSTCNAALIDFETVPLGAPSDKLAISTQYQADYGVTFSLAGGGTPYLEKTGANDTGQGFWTNNLGTYDTEVAGYEGRLGNYFLRFGTNTYSKVPGPTLIISYDTPVNAASAEIWDIDATTGGSNGWEAWTITARDITGGVLDTVISPDGIDQSLPGSLDGKPWTWSFDRANNDIYSIAIEFSGTASLVGLAFDNFSPSTAAVVPIPAALWLFGSGLIGLISMTRLKK